MNVKDAVRRVQESSADFDDILAAALQEDPAKRDAALRIMMKHNDAIAEVEGTTLKAVCELFDIPVED